MFLLLQEVGAYRVRRLLYRAALCGDAKLLHTGRNEGILTNRSRIVGIDPAVHLDREIQPPRHSARVNLQPGALLRIQGHGIEAQRLTLWCWRS